MAKIEDFLYVIKNIEIEDEEYIRQSKLRKSALIQKMQQIEMDSMKENGLEFMYAKCGQFFSPNKVVCLAEIDGREVMGAFGDLEHHSIIKNVSGINLAGFKLDQEK